MKFFVSVYLRSDIPNAFWHRKKHIVDLPYVKDFNEKNIPTNIYIYVIVIVFKCIRAYARGYTLVIQ